MASFFNENLRTIQNRWPGLAEALAAAPPVPRAELVQDGPQATLRIDGIFLASRYDRGLEAAQQAKLIPLESKEGWIYGLGLGDLPRALLERPALERLRVVLINSSVACQSFEFFDHRDWLDDARVELLTAADQTRVNFPFAAVPSCLRLADEATARLRDLVELELATPFIRKRHAAGNPDLQARLGENEPLVASDGDAEELFGCYPETTILVAGAGPTLAEHFDALRERTTPLIAVDAALKPLTKNGIVPEVVVTCDGNAEMIGRFFREADLSCCARVPLVYFPTVHKGVLAAWPGPRKVAYSSSGLFQKLRNRHPRAELFSSGSVIHPAVDLAVRMGASRIVLLGADFAFPGGRSHVAGCVTAQLVEKGINDPWVLDREGRRLATTNNLRGYLRDLESYIERHVRVSFVTGSNNGAHIHGTSLLEAENAF